MLINLREKKSDKLLVKDYLDVDFDMVVEETLVGKFVVSVNKTYRLDDQFISRQDAEDAMLKVMDNRNQLENEFRDF